MCKIILNIRKRREIINIYGVNFKKCMLLYDVKGKCCCVVFNLFELLGF